MFGFNHYIPVLRWKQAEWKALANLHLADRTRMTPLIEITPQSVAPRQRRATTAEMLAKNAEDMRNSWNSSSLFVDLWLLDSHTEACGVHPLEYLAQRASAEHVSLIPVTGLDRRSDYQSAVRSVIEADAKGVCIRLLEKELVRPALREQLDQLLYELSIHCEETDLIIDYQVTSCHALAYAGLCALLPHLKEWRTLTVVSGNFPRDLTGFSVGAHLLPRRDWITWRDQVTATPHLPRRPSYGDYTIQHAMYRAPPQRPNFSASIRYTTEVDWLIMRGEGVFHVGSPGFDQWPANAQLLCARPEFCGGNFSYGDQYIEHMGQQTTRSGSAETWLRAGINHHMTYVVRQIASLFET